MENKCLKKSTTQQLRALVVFMEDNPELARGAPVFGGNKVSVDEEWKKLCNNLNSLGPPTRTIGEWKKTWADLKSRTKKKIGENRKSLRETGGGLYRYTNLTELEVIIDRTLFISSAVAPGGKVFGVESQSIDDCFETLMESPARCSKAVAVVTPNRTPETSQPQRKPCNNECLAPQNTQQISTNKQKNDTATKLKQNCLSESDNEQSISHLAKKAKSEQIILIRRQLRVAEKNAAAATEQASSLKRMADAAEVQAEAAKTLAAGINELQLRTKLSVHPMYFVNLEKF